MNVKEEQIRVTFTDLTRIDILFELKHSGIVIATEAGRQARQVGRIPQNAGPLERDLHWWCAAYVHENYENVLMTESSVVL